MSNETNGQPTPSSIAGPSLADLIEASKARLAAMTEDERQAMWQAQRESFGRAMSTPCEHGVLDFEQCEECRNPAPKAPPVSRTGGSEERVSYGLSVQSMTLGQIFDIVGHGAAEEEQQEPDLPDAPRGATSYHQAQKSFEAYFAENYPTVDQKQAPKLFGAAVTAIRAAKAMEGKSQ